MSTSNKLLYVKNTCSVKYIKIGIDNGNQLVLKMTNVVAQELNLILDFILSKNATNNTNTHTQPIAKSIDCDISNIIYKISCQHSGIYSIRLVHNIAIFLKSLVDNTRYFVTPIFDGDIYP